MSDDGTEWNEMKKAAKYTGWRNKLWTGKGEMGWLAKQACAAHSARFSISYSKLILSPVKFPHCIPSFSLPNRLQIGWEGQEHLSFILPRRSTQALWNKGLSQLCTPDQTCLRCLAWKAIKLSSQVWRCTWTWWERDSVKGKKGLYVLLSRSQAGPGRNFSQPCTNHFFPLCTAEPCGMLWTNPLFQEKCSHVRYNSSFYLWAPFSDKFDHFWGWIG